MQMLILCSMSQEKTTTQTTCQTNKKQCLLTFLKKWIIKTALCAPVSAAQTERLDKQASAAARAPRWWQKREGR